MHFINLDMIRPDVIFIVFQFISNNIYINHVPVTRLTFTLNVIL